MRVFSLILFQSVANFPGSKSNSKNIDPKFESSFARFLQITSYQIILSILMSNETIFIDFFQSVANFPGSKAILKTLIQNLSLHLQEFSLMRLFSMIFFNL